MNLKRGIVISIFIIVFILATIAVMLHFKENKKVELNLSSKVEFLENETVSVETTILENIEKTKKIKLEGERIELKYKQTRDNLNIYYVENKKDEYIFKDGKLVGFLKDTNPVLGVDGDKETAEKIAKKFGKNNIKNFDQYELVYEEFVNYYGEYSFNYMRKIGGISTNDTVKINVSSSGEVVAFSAINHGVFDKYKNAQINIEGVNDLCLEAIQDKYKKDIKDMKIKEQYLKILNEKLVLQTDVEIVLENNKSNELPESYEMESLICEIN